MLSVALCTAWPCAGILRTKMWVCEKWMCVCVKGVNRNVCVKGRVYRDVWMWDAWKRVCACVCVSEPVQMGGERKVAVCVWEREDWGWSGVWGCWWDDVVSDRWSLKKEKKEREREQVKRHTQIVCCLKKHWKAAIVHLQSFDDNNFAIAPHAPYCDHTHNKQKIQWNSQNPQTHQNTLPLQFEQQNLSKEKTHTRTWTELEPKKFTKPTNVKHSHSHFTYPIV